MEVAVPYQATHVVHTCHAAREVAVADGAAAVHHPDQTAHAIAPDGAEVAAHATRGIAVADAAVAGPRQTADVRESDHAGAQQAHVTDGRARVDRAKHPDKVGRRPVDAQAADGVTQAVEAAGKGSA